MLVLVVAMAGGGTSCNSGGATGDKAGCIIVFGVMLECVTDNGCDDILSLKSKEVVLVSRKVVAVHFPAR